MLKVKTIVQDCFACPSSWSGLLEDGRHWRARYRWGVLRFTVDADRNTMSVFSEATPEVEEEIRLGDEYDGVCSFADVQRALAEKIDFSTVEEIKN